MTHESAKQQRATYRRWARLYDLSTVLAERVYGFSDIEERRKAAERLGLEAGQRALEVTVGTGANLPVLAECVGASGTLVGLDITPAMLRIATQRLQKEGIAAHLIEGDAKNLPFPDHEFDGVLSFGGFNGLDDREQGLREMTRVAKPGAKIVIADEGMSERKRRTFLGKLFIRRDPWLACGPPVELLPPGAQGVRVGHFRAENWYLIDFTNGS